VKVDGETIFDKFKAGRFPEEREIFAEIRKRG